MIQISVLPVPGGWSVKTPFSDTLMFISGGRAERAAVSLARGATAAGQWVELVIHTRDGRLAGRRAYSPVPG